MEAHGTLTLATGASEASCLLSAFRVIRGAGVSTPHVALHLLLTSPVPCSLRRWLSIFSDFGLEEHIHERMPIWAIGARTHLIGLGLFAIFGGYGVD